MFLWRSRRQGAEGGHPASSCVRNRVPDLACLLIVNWKKKNLFSLGILNFRRKP